jgi:excisionase family DNA binding protein
MPTQLERLFTSKEVMDYLKISRATFDRLMQSGKLTRRKVGAQLRFYERDVQACIGKQDLTSPHG